MKVIRAKILGFCSGVRQAVETAWNESEKMYNCPDNCSGEECFSKDCPAEVKKVYTLGPLIHNPAVLEALSERGVGVLCDEFFPADAINSTVIIRAHGVSPAVEKKFSRQGVRIVDTTCLHVKKSQKYAFNYAEKGYKVFLAGEKNHEEITGICGYVEACSESSCFVVGSPAEAEERAAEIFFEDKGASTVLIGQTTFSSAEYRAIEEAILKFFPNLLTLDTICGATAARQKALKELCRKVDAVIIAGGKESSNTRRLLSLARELGKPAWLVEEPDDIDVDIISELEKYKTVGLSAGASTPDDLIDGIEQALSRL